MATGVRWISEDLCLLLGCGAELLGPSGSFNSPGYPNRYPENRECIWYISTAAGSSITLTIHEFDVEYHQDCNYDVLEVPRASGQKQNHINEKFSDLFSL